MSTALTFETSKLPSFLAKAGVINSDLTTNVGGGGFPVMSIKGKVFTLIKNQVETMVSRPDDPEEPASFIEVIILKANPNLSKVWYAKKYEPGEKMGKPNCFSNDGVKPESDSDQPQAKTCAACPHNAFKSADNGKGKACQDSRRIAISTADQINEPMLLRVPPATLKPLAEYGKMLNNRGVSYTAVITKIRFDRDAETPKLTFTPMGFVTEEQYAEVQEVAQSEIVQIILASSHVDVNPADTFEQVAAPAVKLVKKVAVVEEDEEVAAPPKVVKKVAVVEEAEEAAPVVVKKAKVVTMADDLDSLLDALDD